MLPIECKIIPWKSLPTHAKKEFHHPSGMGSDFFQYDNEWYCIDYLYDRCDTHEYQNHTMRGTIISCDIVNNLAIVKEEYTEYYIPNIEKLLALH